MGTLWPLGSVHCPTENWFPHSLTLLLYYHHPLLPLARAPNPQFIGHAGDIIHSLKEHAIYGTHTNTQLYCQ